MVVLIAGSSHTGKTLLAQRLLERYGLPYLSLDHLKMGLIRSGACSLSPEDSDEALTAVLWPIAAEMVKTVIENEQSLVVEGCYIPFAFQRDFDERYRTHIRYVCLVFSERYINAHYDDILRHANAIERRLEAGGPTKALLLEENAKNLASCREQGLDYLLIDDGYEVKWSL